MSAKATEAAAWLLKAHAARERFQPLPAALSPTSPAEAYAIQEAFASVRAAQRGAAIGYKIALSSAAMRRFVGVDSPQAGMMFESTIRQSPARIRAADYVNLIVEFEIAVELAEDLPARTIAGVRSTVDSKIAPACGSSTPTKRRICGLASAIL